MPTTFHPGGFCLKQFMPLNFQMVVNLHACQSKIKRVWVNCLQGNSLTMAKICIQLCGILHLWELCFMDDFCLLKQSKSCTCIDQVDCVLMGQNYHHLLLFLSSSVICSIFFMVRNMNFKILVINNDSNTYGSVAGRFGPKPFRTLGRFGSRFGRVVSAWVVSAQFWSWVVSA